MRNLLLALAALFSLNSYAEDAATTRLANLAKVWGFAAFHHPSLAYRADIDWDAALLAAIPRTLAAHDTPGYRSAIDTMLAALDDPQTRVLDETPTGSANEEPLTSRLTDDGVLVVGAHNAYSMYAPESQAAAQQAIGDVAKARAVVFDLRSTTPVDDYGRMQITAALEPVERLMTTHAVASPGSRFRAFYGFENQSPFASGQYRSGFFVRSGTTLSPSPKAHDLPCVIVLNANAPLPASLLALHATGECSVVFEGDPSSSNVGEFQTLDAGEGVVARVRIADSILADGTSARLRPDVVVPKDGVANALESALNLARRFTKSNQPRQSLPAIAANPDRRYPSIAYPPLETRLLALFRFWTTIDELYPYKDLLDERWDAVLLEMIPRFEQASNGVEYARAVADLATRLHDSHAYVAGDVYNRELIGEGYPPIRVRMIEGQPVVTSIASDVSADIKAGDVVVSVDGEDARTRLTRYAALISASTPQSLMDKAAIAFMNGPIGSSVTLTLRGNGDERSVALPRSRQDYMTLYHHERSGDVVRVVPGNIGYVE